MDKKTLENLADSYVEQMKKYIRFIEKVQI